MLKILLYHLRLYYRTYKALANIKSRYPSSIIGRRVEIISHGNLELGEKVSIQDDVVLHCGGADWCNNTGFIKIGSQSVISSYSVFWGCGAKIVIGNNFDCAPGVRIFASRTEYEKKIEYPQLNPHVFQDVHIGDNVICYANVVIAPGVKIGNGAVIGANSLILSDVPENTLVAGSPARIIREIDRKDQ